MKQFWMYGALGALLVFRLWVGLVQPINNDEIVSIFFANDHTYHELFEARVEPIHPNGFYIFLKILLDAGFDDVSIRIVMWGLFVSSLLPLYKLFRMRFSHHLSLVGLMLISMHGYILHFSYQIRMYGPAIALMIWSLYLYLKWKETKKSSVFMLMMFLDILGASLVAGYLLFVVLKMPDLLRNKRLLVGAMHALLIALFGLPLLRLFGEDSLSSTFGYWMPEISGLDMPRMTSTLLGITSTSYYEGFSSIPSNIWIAAGASALMTLSFIMLWKTCVECRAAALLVTGMYVGLFVLSMHVSNSLWHVRQLFGVGVLLSIAIMFGLLYFVRQRNYFGLSGLALLVVLQLMGFSGYFDPIPLYPQRYEPVPDLALIASESDVEFVYDYCGASSFLETKNACAEKGVMIVESLKDEAGYPQEFAITRNAYKSTLIKDNLYIRCDDFSLDFYVCENLE